MLNKISLTKSGLKYLYLTIFFALLSGFFYPLMYKTNFADVIVGILVLFLGLGGGILVYKSLTYDKRQLIFLVSGFSLMFFSLYLIFILSGRI